MKKTKRLWSIVMCLALAVSVAMLAAACNKGGGGGPEGTAISTADELLAAFDEDGKYYLANDITVTDKTVDVTANVELNLNGKTLKGVFTTAHSIEANKEKVPGTTDDRLSGGKHVVDSYVLNIKNGGSLTVNAENGGAINGDWQGELTLDKDMPGATAPDRSVMGAIFNIGSIESATAPNAKLIINGGEFNTLDSAVMIHQSWGIAEVNGGKFEMDFSTGGSFIKNYYGEYGADAMFNRINFGNKWYQNVGITDEQDYYDNVKVLVKGGTFKGFNPAAMTYDDNKPETYVPTGYVSAPGEGGWYTVTAE